MKIEKSKGQTRTEKKLSVLCDKTFLKLWSYPNPYKSDGKEMCDLLVVFENHVFIFFDRESSLAQNPEKDLDLIWSRWKKEVIEKQIKTVEGAKKYIKQGNPIYLDDKQQLPLPVKVPEGDYFVHKIIIAHGAQDACKSSSVENVSGSLGVVYGGPTTLPFPFMIQLNREDPVHVFDSENLDIIFEELDTVHDFISYLQAKETTIQENDMVLYCAEEDLLAYYFMNNKKSPEAHFEKSGNGNQAFVLGEGIWEEFRNTDSYRRKKEADKISFVWDDFIQRTCENALDDVLIGEIGLFGGQNPIKEMAKEPRLFRRILSERIIKAVQDFPANHHGNARYVTFIPSFFDNKGYVFLQLKEDDISESETEYHSRRQAILTIACGAAKNEFPHLSKIIGIATEAPKFRTRASEDFILFNGEVWTEEDKTKFEELNQSWKFFQSEGRKQSVVRIEEVPSRNLRKVPKIGRNDACPCGSGKKFKKCHGR
jgi:hypothetical protein